MTRSNPSSVMEAMDSGHSSVFGSRQRLSALPESRSVYSEELLPTVRDPHERYHPAHKKPTERTDPTGDGAREADSPWSPTRTPERRRRSLGSDSELARDIMSLKARLALLETQIKSPIGEQGNPTTSPDAIALDSLVIGRHALSDNLKDSLNQQQITPRYVERSWPDFMNKDIRRTDEYAVEVLHQEPSTADGVLAEKPIVELPEVSTQPTGAACDESAKSSAGPAFQDQVPARIRINSPIILKALSDIDASVDDAAVPLVMLRPYKLLVRHASRIRHMLSDFESGAQQTEKSETAVNERHIRVDHLRCLVDFMDHYIQPTLNRLRDGSTTKIYFRDLWYLFQPGEDIYMPIQSAATAVAHSPDSMETTPEVFRGRYNMIWRVTGTGGGRPSLIDDSQAGTKASQCHDFSVNCYYIDFDGKYFLPTNHSFPIYPYDGERDITSLEFYPIRFLKNGQERLREFMQKGKAVFDAISVGFLPFYYAGPTVVSQPCGCPMQEQPLHQRYLESEVIVDFKNTLFNHPEWRPALGFWKEPVVHRDELVEKRPVRYMERSKNQKVNKMKHMEFDYIYDDHVVDFDLAYSFKKKEPIFTKIPSSWAFNAEMVPEKDVMLLAGRVFAFSLRTRSFVALWLWGLTPIKEQKASLNNLQLRDNSRKDTIAKLVSAHFKQSAQQTRQQEYDVVRGKGKGLVILLHGAPGVGKTSTAESIAAASGRPLFSITCGDLGLTPKEVESALEEIFRFAQMWNCILLLDECDIFLARRNKTDVMRNGLVSVFLRTLEFYTGVLFLTTNRVGVIDDAIKSRLTWTAYYPPLDGPQTKRIWEVNLRLLRERNSSLDIDEEDVMSFAKSHFRRSMKNDCCWNGRQIQNAFKVASALAEWETHKAHTAAKSNSNLLKPPEQAIPAYRPLLRASHFETIAQGTQAFDYYLREATGRTEADRAFQNTERADDWSFEEEPYDSQRNNKQHESKRGARRPSFNSVQWNNSTGSKPYRGQNNQTHSGEPRSSFSQIKRSSITSSNGENRPSRKSAAHRSSNGQLYGASSSNENPATSLGQVDDWPRERAYRRRRRSDEYPDEEVSQGELSENQSQYEGQEDDAESWNC